MRQCLTNVEASARPCTEIAWVGQGYAQGDGKKTSHLLPCWSMSTLATDLEAQRSLGVRQRAFLLCIASIDCLWPLVLVSFSLEVSSIPLKSVSGKVFQCTYPLPTNARCKFSWIEITLLGLAQVIEECT